MIETSWFLVNMEERQVAERGWMKTFSHWVYINPRHKLVKKLSYQCCIQLLQIQALTQRTSWLNLHCQTISRKELLRNGPDKRAQGIVNYKTAWLYSFWIASLTRHMMRADQSETPGVLPPFFFRCPSSGNTSSPRPYLIGALLFPWSGTWPIVCHFKGQ